MIDLIHIGDYKTGTSWWQSQVWPQHLEICYVDNPAKYPEFVRLRHRLVDSRDLDFDADELREQFSKVLDGMDSTGKKRVMCCEALSGSYPGGDHAKRIAERLHAVFGNVKTLIVIREQFSMLKAIYSQYVKIGGTLSLKAFIYDPISSPGLIEKLKYHKIIAEYEDLFGKDNVLIGLFEDFKLDNLSFVNQIFEFICCSTNWDKPLRKGVVNPSLRLVGLEAQRFLNHFLRNDFNPRMSLLSLGKVASIFLDAEKKKRLVTNTRNRFIYSVQGRDEIYMLRYALNFTLTRYISEMCERIPFGPKLCVPESIIKDLQGEFVESNRVLRDRYGLPIDKYGWVL